MVISKFNGIYELPLELLNDLTLGVVGNQKTSEKSQNCSGLYLSDQTFSQNKHFGNTSKNLLKSRCSTFPTVHSFT